MNIIKLCGGLGNQFFQYAFGQAMQENKIEVRYDPAWYNTKSAVNPQRKYVLDKFETDVEFGTRFPGRAVSESGFNPRLLFCDGFNFNGYWQYPAYYLKILPKLREQFRIKKEFYTEEFVRLREEIILRPDSVGVHVRRGDYLILDGFPVLPVEYYKKALEIFHGTTYIFSDDPQWCKDNFAGAKIIHLNEYFDFELLRLCKKQIISRSSYSWWAGYLNFYPQNVIAPSVQLTCPVRAKAKETTLDRFDLKEWTHVD